MLVINVVLLAGFALGAIRVRAALSKIYDDFETELPALTQWLMWVPDWLVFLGASLALVALVVKEALVRNARVNRRVNLAVLIGLLGLGAVVAVALLEPLTRLITPLS